MLIGGLATTKYLITSIYLIMAHALLSPMVCHSMELETANFGKVDKIDHCPKSFLINRKYARFYAYKLVWVVFLKCFTWTIKTLLPAI